ncbi:MAG: hypothetical protein Q8Q08_03590 [Candidatus Omnitrophota bacterium]|nr:hypothetical protein [Candidatus Omnitrophota bacterium]
MGPLCDQTIIVVSRQDVEAKDIGPILPILKRFLESPEVARFYMEKVDIAFDGYNNFKEELHEIPEVRNYVHMLDEQFPFWLFFLSKYMLGLQCIAHCFLSPYLTEEAQTSTHPEELGKLLINRWVPALNHVAQYAGLSDQETDELLNRAIKYFKEGQFKQVNPGDA